MVEYPRGRGTLLGSIPQTAPEISLLGMSSKNKSLIKFKLNQHYQINPYKLQSTKHMSRIQEVIVYTKK